MPSFLTDPGLGRVVEAFDNISDGSSWTKGFGEFGNDRG